MNVSKTLYVKMPAFRSSSSRIVELRLCVALFCLASSDSDSDSELSVDEHSSSYASSHSSDSEDDDEEVHMKPKWNNERQPLHSTPKGSADCLFISTRLS